MNPWKRLWTGIRNRVVRPVGRSIFKAAEVSRLTLDWVASCLRVDEEIRYELRKLRARARELARNNPIVRQYINLLKTNVIGPNGPKYQSTVRRGGQLDKPINDAFEEAWDAFSRSKVSVDRKHTLVDFQHLAMQTVAVDGEALVRLHLGFGNEWGFALQLIDADLLDENYNRERGSQGNEIRMGVEVDIYGAPVAYWISEDTRSFGVSMKRTRVPASEIIHLYKSERGGQTRGVTWLQSVMYRLNMLNGYDEAELIAARMSAAKPGALEWDPQLAGGEVPSGANGQPPQMTGEPGSVMDVPYGRKLTFFDPSHPTTAYGDFIKAALRTIASGLFVSYNALANDLENVNYSSIRSGVLIERDGWKLLQIWWISEFLTPVHDAWKKTALLSGAIALPGGASRDRRLYAACEWRPRGWAWVDPKNDVEASILAIQNKLASRTQILAERGDDLEEILEQLKHEDEIAAQYGIDLTPAPAAAPPAAPASDEEDAPPSKNGTSKNRLQPTA